jgi:beta-mannosidase
MVHLGIWESVHLDFTGAIRLEDVWVRPQLNADYDNASITTELALDSTQATAVPTTLTLLDPQGWKSPRNATNIIYSWAKRKLALKTAIAEPQLWWPNATAHNRSHPQKSLSPRCTPPPNPSRKAAV